MKKKQGTLAVLLVLVLLAGGALALLTDHNRKEEAASSAATEGTIQLLSFGTDQLSELVVETGDETLTLVPENGRWTLAEDPAYHLDDTACSSMRTALADLKAKRQLDAEAGEDYGLDAPQAVVTVCVDGQTTTLRFGAENAVTGDVYLQKEGDDTIYTVASSRLSPFQTSKTDLFGAFNPAGLTRSSIQAISYTWNGGKTISLSAVSEPIGTSEAAASSADGAASETESNAYRTVWRLSADPSANLDTEKTDAFLTALSSYVTAQTTNGDPSACGFDAPLGTVDVTTPEGTVTLTYAMGTDGYYLMVSGDDSIYTVDGSTVQTLQDFAAELQAAS